MPNESKKSWLAEVLEYEEEDYYEPEDVYEFSNGRKFKSTDKSDHGFYEDD